MSDDRWHESDEGDLDPDLTEEAGYAGWEPRRGWFQLVTRIVLAFVLLVFLASLVLRAV